MAGDARSVTSAPGWLAFSLARSGVSMIVSPRRRLCAMRTRSTCARRVPRQGLRASARDTASARVLVRSPTEVGRAREHFDHPLDHQLLAEARMGLAVRARPEGGAARRVVEQIGELHA